MNGPKLKLIQFTHCMQRPTHQVKQVANHVTCHKKLADRISNSPTFPWLFQVYKIYWQFQVFQVCGNPDNGWQKQGHMCMLTDNAEKFGRSITTRHETILLVTSLSVKLANLSSVINKWQVPQRNKHKHASATKYTTT